jgi:hypothetical protein
MDLGGVVIVAVNTALALGCGWPLAVRHARLRDHPGSRWRVLAALLGTYFLEAFAFAASMGTDSHVLSRWGGNP